MFKDIRNVDCDVWQVQLWYKQFKEGRDVNDDVRPVHMSTSTTDKNIKAVKKMIVDG